MKRKARVKVKAGDRVLIGTPGISLPMDWFMATVLWADADEILTQHEPPSRQPPQLRQVMSIDSVRAVGDDETLMTFRKEACEAVEAEQRKVRELESELGRARNAVWAKLDELAADVKEEA